jgi:hypothetical protein
MYAPDTYAPRVIAGHDGPVQIDEVKRTVTKIYLYCRHEDAVRKAEREVSHATRLLDSFSRVDGLSCPRIIAWEQSFPPRVIMQLCPGEVLSSYLRRVGKRDGRIAEIAHKIHDGLEIYTRLFEEPDYDCCFQNILYDESSRVLTFLDFGLAPPIVGSEGSAIEAMLAKLAGWACYDLVRPSRLFMPKRAYLGVLQSVLSSFESQVCMEHVRELAHGVFRRLGGNGPLLRRSYYRVAGTIFTGPCWHLLASKSVLRRSTSASDKNDGYRDSIAA